MIRTSSSSRSLTGGDLQETYRGPDGWRSFFETWEEAWETVAVSVERIEDLNGHVLALVRFDRVGKHSGTAVSIDVGHIWTFHEGQVTHILALPWPEALEAVGLSSG